MKITVAGQTSEKYCIFQIRFLALVPPIMVFLSKHSVCDQYDLSSVQLLICGAAPAGKDLCEEISRKYPNIRYIQQGTTFHTCRRYK